MERAACRLESIAEIGIGREGRPRVFSEGESAGCDDKAIGTHCKRRSGLHVVCVYVSSC